MARYTFPLCIAAAVLMATYAVTFGIMQTIEPRPGGSTVAVVAGVLSLLFGTGAVWVRHEKRRDRGPG